MGEKTQENSQMGYSAAYPTGAERFIFGRVGVEVERWRIRDGEGWYRNFDEVVNETLNFL